MSKYRSYDLLKKLYFVRVSATEDELKAANIIKDECEKLGVTAWIEDFEVDNPSIKKASVNFYNPDFSPECVGVGMSGSTPEDGLTGELIYVENEEFARISDLKDKICLVDFKIIPQKLYKVLVEKGAKGIIECCGDVYRNADDVDLDPYFYRERNYKFGKIPAVCIRLKDAEKILNAQPKRAKIVNIQDETKGISHNVVAEIKGTTYPDEVIAFSAHYDSVPFSKGIYDNATGSTTIMQMLAFYAKNPPKRTLRFIWCGSEECGLLGSKAYVEAHKEEIEKTYRLNINVDMTGVTLGFDLACVTGPQSLVDNISYYGKEVGFAIKANMGVYSSDSTPFADAGIPAISFARLPPRGGAQIHSHRDVKERLNSVPYYKTCAFIENISKKWINSVCFPVPKEIPDNMKTELDYYLFRKERP